MTTGTGTPVPVAVQQEERGAGHGRSHGRGRLPVATGQNLPSHFWKVATGLATVVAFPVAYFQNGVQKNAPLGHGFGRGLG